jgi:hypothetical protein
MTLPTGDETDPQVLLGRLIERIDQSNLWAADWHDYVHFRFEVGAKEMSDLRSQIAALRTLVEYQRTALENLHHPADHHEAQPRTKGFMGSLIEFVRAAKELVQAVESLKRLALAVAIMVASAAVMQHPEIVTSLIASYSASGRDGHE